MAFKPDVIVLGGGAAGAMAARELTRAGLAVLLIEARDRLGGRVHTTREPSWGPLPVELGAEFIHGTPRVTYDLVREAGLVTFDAVDSHWQVREGKLAPMGGFGGVVGQVMDRLDPKAKRDQSFADFLARLPDDTATPEARAMARAFVEGYDAADARRISAKAIAEEWHAGGNVEEEPQLRVVNGYGSVIDHLRDQCPRERLRVELRREAVEIRWRRGRVSIVTRRGKVRRVFTAPRAVVTLPVGVLQRPVEEEHAVRFKPDLPHKREAAGRIGVGPVVKVVLRFRHAFWEDDEVSRVATHDGKSLRDATFMHDPNAMVPTWWTLLPLRAPVLTGWAGGPKAEMLSGRGEHAILDIALVSLSNLLAQPRERIDSLLVASRVSDWLADSFARGGYTFTTVDGSDARQALAEPVEDTLFFAGEATDTEGQASTVAGALASGVRAAKQVLAAVRG